MVSRAGSRSAGAAAPDPLPARPSIASERRVDRQGTQPANRPSPQNAAPAAPTSVGPQYTVPAAPAAPAPPAPPIAPIAPAAPVASEAAAKAAWLAKQEAPLWTPKPAAVAAAASPQSPQPPPQSPKDEISRSEISLDELAAWSSRHGAPSPPPRSPGLTNPNLTGLGFAPAAPTPAAPAAPAAAAAVEGGKPLTMAERMALVTKELGLERDTPVPRAVAAANQVTGLRANPEP